MGAPYSYDLRLRVMDAVHRGMAYEEVTLRFRVSNSTILRWVRRLRESGHYAALPMGGKKPFVLADELEWLLSRVAAKPDLTLRELLAEVHDRGVEVSYFALWHIVRRAGLRFKKRPSTPASRTGPMSPVAEAGGDVGYNG
jgi:transposase